MQEPVKTKSSIRTLVAILLLFLIAATGALVGYNYWSKNKHEVIKKHSENIDLSDKSDSLPKKRVVDPDGIMSVTPFTDTDLQTVRNALMLTQLAAENLQTTKDVNVAKKLLKAAQDTLVSAHNPELVDVIELLAADQVNLSVINSIDTNSLILKVNDLDHMAATLPIKHSVAAAKAKKHKMQTQDNVTKWQQALDAVLSQAKTVVKVRQKSEVEAEMSQIGMEMQRAHVKLLLSQLRWAIYYHDAAVYQSSIQQLGAMVPQLYDADVQAFERVLSEMAVIQVQADMPDIQDTVKALQSILVR